MANLLQAVSGLAKRAGNALGMGSSNSQENDSPDLSSDALEFVRGKWQDLKNAYIVYHQAIYEAILFYANQTWIEVDKQSKTWVQSVPDDEWVPRPRINRFSPSIDAVCSNFFKVPEVEAMPIPDDDPTAMQVANIANKFLDHWFTTNGFHGPYKGMKDKSGMAAQLFVLAGAVFTNVYPHKRKVGTRPAPGQPQPGINAVCEKCDKMTTLPVTEGMEHPETCPDCGGPLQVDKTTIPGPPDPDAENEEVYEYSIKGDVESPVGSMPRPGSLSLDDSPYFLFAKRLPIDTIYFRFDGFDATADNIWPDGFVLNNEQALSFWYTGFSSSTLQTQDSCMVLQMYVQPEKLKDFPNGFYSVVINNESAHYEDWQYPEHPMTMGGYLDLPTIFVPRSIAFDLVEIQRELNAYESIIKLHAMTSASDPIIVDANTLVSEITGRADKVIKWRSVSQNSKEPHRMESGHLDDGIYKQRDNLHAEFQNISMAVNSFRGQQEGAVVAAQAISQLRGQAEQMFSKPQDNWATLWRETARKAAKFAQKYLTYAQLQGICGPGNIADIRAFKQADLDKSLDYVATSHGMPRTRDERKQEMMTMWDKGALDISQPEVRQRIYELFGETGMMKGFNLDATRARLENQAFKTGASAEQIKPMVGIEDLSIHFYQHASRIKSIEFDTWPQAAKEQLIIHTQQTEGFIRAQQIQQEHISAIQSSAGKSNSQIHGEAGARASAATPPSAKEAPKLGPGGPTGPGPVKP